MPLHLDLDLTPESATRARRAVRGLLEQTWPESLTAAAMRDLAAVAELVAAELVANSVRHGATPVTLDVDAVEDAGARAVTVVASDGGTWDGTAPDETGGRGLLLVGALSVSLQVQRGEQGTSVLVRLQRPWPPRP